MCTADSQSPEFISYDSVLELHSYLVNRFGGSLGLRDEGLLESALSQPLQTFCGELLHSTIYEQAAAYLYHIAKNHAFIDGNKRIALATTISFLKINGYRLSLCKKEADILVLEVVSGNLNKEELSLILKEYVVKETSE